MLAVAAYGTIKDFLDAVYQFPGGALTARLGHKKALVAFNVAALCGSDRRRGDYLGLRQRARHAARHRDWNCDCRYRARGAVDALSRFHNRPMSFRQIANGVTALDPDLKRLLASDIIVRFGQGTAEVYAVVYVIHVLGMSAAAFGLFVGIAMATSLVVYVPVARIADRTGRVAWVTLTYAFFAAFPLVLGLSRSPWMVVLSFVLMGLREIGEPPRKAMIVDLARAGRRSVDVGAYYLVRGLAVFPASLLGGVLWRITSAATFFAAAAIAACGLTFFRAVFVARR